jgi:probable F420-dependent oxidoreductase
MSGTIDRAGLSLGVATPIVTQLGRGSGHWCATYWDPLATFGYLAAVTERIRFATNVLVLGYHHPLEIAKRYGTLDLISGGRLTLGVGVGTLVEEFELLGVPFEDRGARADDALRCLRSCLSKSLVSYDGPYYSFHDLIVEPHAVQEPVPIWVGGRTLRSLRRAVGLGEGWAPFGLSLAEVKTLLGEVDLPPDFEIVLGTEVALDPIGHPEQAEEALGAAAAAGATICSPVLRSSSLEHHLEQLAALAS